MKIWKSETKISLTLPSVIEELKKKKIEEVVLPDADIEMTLPSLYQSKKWDGALTLFEIKEAIDHTKKVHRVVNRAIVLNGWEHRIVQIKG